MIFSLKRKLERQDTRVQEKWAELIEKRMNDGEQGVKTKEDIFLELSSVLTLNLASIKAEDIDAYVSRSVLEHSDLSSRDAYTFSGDIFFASGILAILVTLTCFVVSGVILFSLYTSGIGVEEQIAATIFYDHFSTELTFIHITLLFSVLLISLNGYHALIIRIPNDMTNDVLHGDRVGWAIFSLGLAWSPVVGGILFWVWREHKSAVFKIQEARRALQAPDQSKTGREVTEH